MDTMTLDTGMQARNRLDEARRQHLLAIQNALLSGSGPREVAMDLVGFGAAANALIALSCEPA